MGLFWRVSHFCWYNPVLNLSAPGTPRRMAPRDTLSAWPCSLSGAPTASIDCSSTLLKPPESFLGGAWLQMNAQVSQRLRTEGPPYHISQEAYNAKARTPRWTIAPDAQEARQPWPSWRTQSPPTFLPPTAEYPTSSPHFLLFPIRLEKLQEKV